MQGAEKTEKPQIENARQKGRRKATTDRDSNSAAAFKNSVLLLPS